MSSISGPSDVISPYTPPPFSGGTPIGTFQGSSPYSWIIKHYDKNSNDLNADYAGFSNLGVSNIIYHAKNRNLNLNLNGIDDCSFDLLLKDPMAYQINKLTSFIKVWRSCPGYTDPPDQPCFAGQVLRTNKNGSSGTMTVSASSPFSRLQFRFHILNHYLKINVLTNAEYTQSELIWKLIDLINNAFGFSVSNTGIDEGIFNDNTQEISVAPYFVAKGTNTWTEIFDVILSRPGSVDIIPRYYHSANDPTMVFLDTALKRGSDKSSTVNFSYHTDSPSNCTNMVEEDFVTAGDDGFANYLWAVGQGGPNSGKVAVASDAGVTGFGYHSIGIYMKRLDYSDIKRV
jgi:hypothetical protein